MGYRGKVAEQQRARKLRAEGWTYKEIVEELGVSRSTVSGSSPGLEPPRRTRRPRRLYLHAGLDLEAAVVFWSELTRIPVFQFGRPYRAEPDPSIRTSKHPMGCPSVAYTCSRTHRTIMGLVHALLSCEDAIPG